MKKEHDNSKIRITNMMNIRFNFTRCHIDLQEWFLNDMSCFEFETNLCGPSRADEGRTLIAVMMFFK